MLSNQHRNHWHDVDYFALLLRREAEAYNSALEYLVDDLHQSKDLTVYAFLDHAGSEDLLWSLVTFLGNKNPRVAGNSAYILGTIAESEPGRKRVISLTESRHAERKKILPDLVALLSSTDSESVMNAAGTIGTIAESEEGRDWLLREPCTQLLVERVTALLMNENAWTASNAALVLARLTISERGCELLLNNALNKVILCQLIGSLGTDEAGRGMNAAFAIGRLCDISKGRSMLLTLPEAGKMVTYLSNMLCSDDSGSSKNSCFAVSCLAASAEGHEKLLENGMCCRVMNTLASLLSAEDSETGWFAAMTLRTFSSRPKGCMKLRELPKVLHCLQQVVSSPHYTNEEMVKEVEETLSILKLLEKPSPPVATVLGPRSVRVSWAKAVTRSGLPVSYRLVEGSRCVYSGSALEVTLSDLTPSDSLTLKLRASVPGDDSPYSDSVSVTTDEDVPQEPSSLSLLARTATQLKIGWEPPSDFCGAIKSYYVYLDGSYIEHTNELSFILSGLKEHTTYTVEVCASTSKGKGAKAILDCATADLGDHCPSKPSLTSMGRSEINVSWNPPQVPLGRITRYDVSMNGKVFHSGTDLHCTARHLTPNTEYTFVVTVITNEGPQDSKPAKKRTAKDEYDCQRLPLYIPPLKKEETKAEGEKSLTNQNAQKKRKKKTSLSRAQSRNRLLSDGKSRVAAKEVASTSDIDKPDSAGSSGPAMESQPIAEPLPSTYDLQPSSMFRSQTRTRPDLSLCRGDNPRNAPHYVGDVTRSYQFSSSSSSATQSAVLSSSANRKPALSANASNHKSALPANLSNQKLGHSSHVKGHRASVPCTDQEQLARTLTSLNIATFEPMLPPSLGQRSTTFLGQKRQMGPLKSAQNQYTTVAHGNAAPFTMEIPRKLSLANHSAVAGSKFTQRMPRGQHNGSPNGARTYNAGYL